MSTGPGRWVQAVFNCSGEFPNAKERWVPNDTREGELLLLMGCAGRMRFVLHGRRYSLVPWNECGSAIEESAIVTPAEAVAAWAS